MVCVLPAQFGIAQPQKVKWAQDSAGVSELPVEVTLDKADKVARYSSTEGIQVLGEEGSSKTVTLTRPTSHMLSHVRPLYVQAILDGVPMAKIFVDNGAAINILPIATMKKLGRSDHDLVPTNVLVSNFMGDITTTRGILPLNVEVGRQKTLSAFFVVDSRASYNALLGRDGIHAVACLPSSMHQALILWGTTGVNELMLTLAHSRWRQEPWKHFIT